MHHHDLTAFRAARRALRRRPLPRWDASGELGAPLGEGGYGKVFPVSDAVVVKAVRIDADATDDLYATDITRNPLREVAIFKESNRLVARGATDHVALLLATRSRRSRSTRAARGAWSTPGS